MIVNAAHIGQAISIELSTHGLVFEGNAVRNEHIRGRARLAQHMHITVTTRKVQGKMQAPSSRYQLPDNTDASIRRMIIWLCVAFTGLVILVSMVFYNAQSIARHIPFSAEQRFVRPYEKLISRYFSSMAGDPDITAYLQDLTDSLTQVMDMPADMVIQVHYVDSDEINAFATLGGHMVVFRGLLESVKDENSLSMVLAHEVSHIIHRDPVASVGRGLALQLIIGFATGGGTSADTIIDVMGGSGMALFSRKQETQADISALHALNDYYGHVNGYRNFFETLLEDKPHKDALNPDTTANDKHLDTYVPEWFASHPATENRLQLLDAEKLQMGATSGENLPLPSLVLDLSLPGTERTAH